MTVLLVRVFCESRGVKKREVFAGNIEISSALRPRMQIIDTILYIVY